MNMRKILQSAVISIVTGIAVLVVTGLIPAAAGEGAPGLHTMSTGKKDQKGISVTVYNVNLGLVKDIRDIDLAKGRSELRFMDVASEILPSSVYIRSLKDAESLKVLEQNYEYDLLNPQKLLDKYVGKKVKLYFKNYYTEREEVVEATVLSNNGTPIFQIGDEITYGHPGRIIFPEVPDDLIAKPTLIWLLENTLSSSQEIEASYLTNGINWEADYVVTLNENDDMADLAGWVTIDNRSGTTYRDAKIKLVAGDVHRVKGQDEFREKVVYAARARAPEEQFREEEFFEYHIYTLQRTSTIKNNQTKQISLLNADSVPVKKELVFKGAQYYYRGPYADTMSRQKVGVFVEIENREKNNLGIPIPKGTVRVYKKDREGSLQFAGEDSIDHTPKDETMRIRMGEAFDVTGERKQTSWKKIAVDTYRAGFEIILKNHKKEDVSVRVIEPVPGDWEMVRSSHEYRKTGAFTAEFIVTVPKDDEVKIDYEVMMKY